MEGQSMESYREDREAGSIGIGAMIVFIALILVAAVASTIIIKTAEELQQNAEQTSSDTRQQISGKVSIVDVIAASTGTDITGTTNIATFDVIFRISSGSTGIYPADISYYVTCEISSTLGMAVDSAALPAKDLNLETEIGATTELTAGTTYFGTVTLATTDSTNDETLDANDANPGCAAMATVGNSLNMRIVVDGGGETLTELKVDSVTLGTSMM
jgi:archaellin